MSYNNNWPSKNLGSLNWINTGLKENRVISRSSVVTERPVDLGGAEELCN